MLHWLPHGLNCGTLTSGLLQTQRSLPFAFPATPASGPLTGLEKPFLQTYGSQVSPLAPTFKAPTCLMGILSGCRD